MDMLTSSVIFFGAGPKFSWVYLDHITHSCIFWKSILSATLKLSWWTEFKTEMKVTNVPEFRFEITQQSSHD